MAKDKISTEMLPLPQVLERAKAKYGHLTREQLQEYKMSHGHNLKSCY